MKQILLTLLLTPILALSQNPVTITTINQYGQCRGGMQIDSAFCFPIKDTVNPNIHFSAMRKTGRAYIRPGDFRLYVWDGSKYRPINTFTSALESKLNGISAGATQNQSDSYLLDRNNHTGVQDYTTIIGLSVVGHTGSYLDLYNQPNLDTLMGQSDSLFFKSLIDTKLSSEVDGSITNEIELPTQTGNSGKVLTTNGSYPSWTSLKRRETYSGTTSGSGTYTITFVTSFSATPNIHATCTNCTDTQRIRVTSISTTGFTIQGRSEALGLIFSNANGLNVDVLITEN